MNAEEVEDVWLGPKETCAYLGVTKSWLYLQTRQKNIPHSKINGRLLRFNKRELALWMEGQRQA